MTVQEFFDALPSKVDPAKTAGRNNSFAFDIADVGTWTVTVADGVVSVAEGENDATSVSDNESPEKEPR